MEVVGGMKAGNNQVGLVACWHMLEHFQSAR